MKPCLPKFCFSLLLLVLLAGCNPPDADNTVSTEVQPSSPGHAVFLNNCMVCHQGPGNPPGPNAIITGSEKLASREMFEAFLRNPGQSMMPPFPEGRLSSEDIDQLYEFVKQQATQK